MKKKVTHIKKIEYIPSDGYRFIRRTTHEFLKGRNKLTLADISANSIMQFDFVGDTFICTDDEEVRAFLEFYETHKNGVEAHVFLKKEFKDFIEIPTDEYVHDLNLFLKVAMTKDQVMPNMSQKEIDDIYHRLNKPNDKSSDMHGSNERYYSYANVWTLMR